MAKDINKILIALGAFKDVFSPIESCEMIKGVISRLRDKNFNPGIECVSIADGGEYSSDVIASHFDAEYISVINVLNPYKELVNSGYLMLDNNTAFIGSSDILRISPEFDNYKNPLNLTSYGLGQLVNHAIEQGVKKIMVGLGGTNTVDAGIGMLQALGIKFLGSDRQKLIPLDGKYYSGGDLYNIENIIVDTAVASKLSNINIQTLCDGRITIKEMYTPNNQKIGDKFNNERKAINAKLEQGIKQYANVIEHYLINVKGYKSRLQVESTDFYGVAGGINLSLNAIFNLEMRSGIDFFIDIMAVESKAQGSDLIITGEGRLDNSLAGKTPIGISRIAKKYDKPLLFLTGDVSDSLKQFFHGSSSEDLPSELKDNGISTIISCHHYYKNRKVPDDVIERNMIFRDNTPKILEEAIIHYFSRSGYIQ